MIFYGSKILLLFYFFGCWLLVHSNDVLSLLRSDVGDFCITNSSSALSYTLLNGSIGEGTKLIPEPFYSCNFEDVSGCTNDFNKPHFKRVNSLEYENIPIFDRRWEELPVTTLEHSSFNRLLELKNSENFNITLSLRATKVQFQFCDGKEVETASCYWFFLEYDKFCIMNKPSTGQIPVSTDDLDYSLCEYNTEYPSVEPFIEMGKWRHITFEKQYQHFYVKTIENGKTRKILHYEDENQLIRIQYMFGNSESPAYCKLHKYYYLRTTYVLKDFTTLTRQIRKKVDGTAYQLCFSMFLTTCEQCSTEVIASHPLHFEEVYGRKQLPSSFGYWTEHRVVFRNLEDYFFRIGIRTTSNSTISNNFWSIDNFRFCSSEEYRVSVKQISNLKNCELLSPSKSLSWGESTDIANTKCNFFDQLGGLCIPCNVLIRNGIVGSCQRIKICENMNDNDRCFCSPGYIGPNCQKACEGRTFGYGCKEKCGNCISNTPCNSTHGFCVCDPLFEGGTCHKPRRGSILKEAPLLIESRPNSCIIQLVNKEHYGEDNIKFFLVQYQNQENSGTRDLSTGFSEWTDYGEIRSIHENNTVKVGDLETNTEYSIRILISDYKHNIKILENSTIPFTVCTTTCNDTVSEDGGLEKIRIIKAGITQTSAVLKIKNSNCQSIQGSLRLKYQCNCTDNWCKERSEKFGYMDPQEGVIIKDLQTFCTYNCITSLCRLDNCSDIWHDTFQTKASNPNNISDVIVFSNGKNYINLKWLPPFPPTGSLTYRVITKGKDYQKTYTHNFDPYRCSIWQDYDCAYLTEHIVYGNTYSIQIQAANKEINKYFNVYQIFDVSVEEKASDPPEDLQTYWFQNNTLVVYWKHPNKTNGNLTNFRIGLEIDMKDIFYKTFKKGSNFTERDYQLTYHIWVTIPPSVDVKIEVIALNNMKSKSATKNDSSYPSVPYLLNPLILITNSTESTISVQLNITLRDTRYKEKNGYYLFVLVSDPDTKTRDHNLEHLENLVNETLDDGTRLRVASEFYLNDVNTSLLNFVIGENDEKKSTLLNEMVIVDKPLEARQFYNITILLVSEYNKKFRIKKYNIGNSTQPRMSFNHGENGAYALLFLLILIPVVVGFIIFRKRAEQFFKFKNRNVYANFPASFLLNPNEEAAHSDRFENDIPTNISYISPIYAVSITNFEKYVQTSFSTGELERQYYLLSPEQTEYSEPSIFMINDANNINLNLFSCDSAQVRFDHSSDDEHCFYINASYINGYNVPRAYIAAENPKTDNFESFWRMIWQTNVKHIFMISNIHGGDEESIDQFWPNINEELIFRDITVKNILTKVSANFEIRTFKVKRKDQERKVEKTLFTCWPRDGIPLYHQSLIPFIRKILKVPLSSSNPIIVQCSNGVGKTGTILLIDISLRRSCENGDVDIFKNLQKLRHQKTNMVDHVNQYKLAHLVVSQLLSSPQTSIPCSQMNEMAVKIIDEEEYKIQMDYLRRIEWQNHIMEKTPDYTEIFVTYSEKNRIQNIIPGDFGRVFLEKYPQDDVSSSYINAVQVDGYKCPGRYIVTQQPMPNTVGDFWRLVDEQSISVIVSMNEVVVEDKTCCIFIPSADDSVLRPVDYLLVLCKEEIECPDYSIFYLQVGNSYKREKMDVEVIVFKKWPAKSLLPYNCEEFLSFWEEADRMSKKSKRILITCFDGATASGVFVALSFIIEKMKAEQECDVCQAVQIVRHNRKQFVTDEKQYTFLFVAAIRFINGFQDYANFQKK